ncbi:MAG: AtpZ/AtpI family protein [Planctomycetota bacterium]
MSGRQPPKWSRRFFGLGGAPPATHGAARQAEDRADDRRKLWNQAGVGMEFAVGVGVFTAAGYGLDTLLGTHPGGLIVGALLGTAAAFYLLLKRMGVIPPRSAASPPAPEAAPPQEARPGAHTHGEDGDDRR